MMEIWKVKQKSWLFRCYEMWAHCMLIALRVCVCVCVEPPAAGRSKGSKWWIFMGLFLVFQACPILLALHCLSMTPKLANLSCRALENGPVWDLHTRGNTHTHHLTGFPHLPLLSWDDLWPVYSALARPNMLFHDHQLAERPNGIVLEGFSQMFHSLGWIGSIPLHLLLPFILLSVFYPHTAYMAGQHALSSTRNLISSCVQGHADVLLVRAWTLKDVVKHFGKCVSADFDVV